MAKASDIVVPYLRDWRATVGWTQEDLATRAGVRRGTVQRAEAGHPINALTLGKLAKALGISVYTLRSTPPGEAPDGAEAPEGSTP